VKDGAEFYADEGIIAPSFNGFTNQYFIMTGTIKLSASSGVGPPQIEDIRIHPKPSLETKGPFRPN
jgi:hypothetical protein